MANLKDLRTRIKSVKSTKKITSAMKMIAAAKLKKAQEAAEASRPYAQEMMRILANLAQNQNEMENLPNLLTGSKQDKCHLILVVSSNRGLCGGFNTNVIRQVKTLIVELETAGKIVKLALIGRKAQDILRRDYENKIIAKFASFSTPKFYNAESIAKDILVRFDKKEFDVCHVVYNYFESALSQKPITQKLIPVQVDQHLIDEQKIGGSSLYDYEPSQEIVFTALLKRNIKIQIFKFLLESTASEHGARMAAMDGATRNAGEMIDRLNLTYNRTRQSVITSELIEIISGAEAL